MTTLFDQDTQELPSAPPTAPTGAAAAMRSDGWAAALPAGPPVAPPPAPPAPPPPGSYPQALWGPPPPPPRPPAPSHKGRTVFVVALVLALVLGAATGALGARDVLKWGTAGSSSSAAPASPQVLPTPGSGGSSGSGSSSSSGATGSAGSGSSSSGSSSSGSATGTFSSWTQVAAAVSPGIVNIESRVSGGVGAGTGMVLTADGQVLTNNHVVEGASQIVVSVSTTGQSYSATIVGTDPSHDVALLQLRGASGMTTIPIGDSDQVKVGDQIAAMGNAGGQGGTPAVASGTVVALGRTITASDQDGSNAETLTGMIQVSANVVPGDSGGPLVNTSGKVVGMDSAASAASAAGAGRGLYGRTTAGEGEGYAIPINRALTIAKQLAASGSSSSSSGSSGSSGSASSSGGFLGVQVQTGAGGGALIAQVQSGSPAANAGLAAGGTITAVDGTRVATADDLVSALADHSAGDKVTITWTPSSGSSTRTQVTLASR